MRGIGVEAVVPDVFLAYAVWEKLFTTATTTGTLRKLSYRAVSGPYGSFPWVDAVCRF